MGIDGKEGIEEHRKAQGTEQKGTEGHRMIKKAGGGTEKHNRT
jgi:hypothetical protein